MYNNADCSDRKYDFTTRPTVLGSCTSATFAADAYDDDTAYANNDIMVKGTCISSTPETKTTTLSPEGLAGIIAGSVVGLICITVAVYCCCIRESNKDGMPGLDKSSLIM